MILKKTAVRKIILVAMTLIILSLRPALPGQILNEALLLIPLLVLSGIYMFLGLPIRTYKQRMVLLILSFWFISYLGVHTVFLSPSNLIPVMYFSIAWVLVGLVATFFFQPDDTRLVLKTMAMVFIILSFSQAVTYIYMFITRNPSGILLGDLVTPNAAQPWPIRWYFPFTTTAGLQKFGGMLFPRATGIYREPGIYQAFLLMTYVSIDYLDFRRKWIIQLLILFALLTVFSTAGYVFFLACLFYKQLLKIKAKRTFLLALLTIATVLIGGFLLWDAGVMGLRYKLYVQGMRLAQTQAVFEALRENPLWGLGIGNTEGGVNFLAFLSSIGLVGGGLYVLMILYSIFTQCTPRTLEIYLPLLLTTLFSQPLYQKGIMVFMLFLSVRSLHHPLVPSKLKAQRRKVQIVPHQACPTLELEKV